MDLTVRWSLLALMCAPAFVGLGVAGIAILLDYDNPAVVGGITGALAALAWLIPMSLRTRRRGNPEMEKANNGPEPP